MTQDTRLTPVTTESLDRPLHSTAPYADASFGKQNDLRDWFRLIVNRKWLIISVALIVTSMTTLYAYSLPPIYEASATVQIDPKETTYMEDSKGNIFPTFNNENYQNTQIKLLSNPQLMRRVVLRLDLEHNQAFLKGYERLDLVSRVRSLFAHRQTASQPPRNIDPGVENDVGQLSPARISELEPYVAMLAGSLKIEPQEKTSLVRVSFTHSDPTVAMQVVDALTKTFITTSSDYESRGSEAAAKTLAQQIAEIQGKIREEESERLNFLKSHNLPLEKGQGRNITEERLGMLSSQLLTAEDDRKRLESSYEAAKSASDPLTIPEVRSSEDIVELRKRIHQLQERRASLLQTYTAEWPEVKKVDSEMRQLQENIDKSQKEAVASLKAKLDAAVGREAKLREAYYKEQGAANNQTQEGVSLAGLNQEIETNRQMYNMLFQRQTQMAINAIDKSDHMGVVTSPVIPAQPVGPARFSKIFISFCASLLAGLGLAVLINQFDNTLKSADDVSSYVYLPTLAMIPARNDQGGWLKQHVRLAHKQRDVNALSLTKDARSPTAEAYQHLRASLLFSSAGRVPRAILVTSGKPFEGKTTTAINTAVTFAQAGADVVLVDCDLRHPQVHVHFGLPNEEGLTTYLSGQHDIKSLFRTPQEYPRLRVLTAGPMPSNPTDFLGSNEMRDLVASLVKQFAHVIIDSPPASSFADASVLSTQVDGVIIVANSKTTSRALVRRVKDRLQELGANIYGVVLNYADLKTDDYYGGYYAQYYSRDGEEKVVPNGGAA
jgi:capsular exopolysaccharide synthesis family protein